MVYIYPMISAILEKIQPAFGTSFLVRKFETRDPNHKANWHFHPEIELVYISKGSGKRHIGNHISYFQNGDLILIGPNVPHYGFNLGISDNDQAQEIVLQFKLDFLGVGFFEAPEFYEIIKLIELSKSGISFHGDTKNEVADLLNSMFHMESFDKLLTLLRILRILSKSEQLDLLNADGVPIIVQTQDNDRIAGLYEFMRSNFQREIPLEEIAEQAAMTVPSFCRYFKKVTGKTFTQLLNEFRIVHACKLLSEANMTISEIAFECGFNNFTNFNKQFKRITGQTPSAYRKEKVQFFN